MKIELEYPFEGFIGYKVFHKGQGRMMLNIIRPDKSRTTISYARYLVCVKEGRILEKHEHVDHCDENKCNDDITNLQILTCKENIIKHVKLNNKTSKDVELSCPICGAIFYRTPQRVNYKLKQGKTPTCSRSCGYTLLSNKNRKKEI